jgi:hypothetical protein
MIRFGLYRPSRVKESDYLIIPACKGKPPDDVVKHFWVGGGHGSSDFDIRSYADLQRYNSSVGSIGREKPCLHIKETIPPAYVSTSSTPGPACQDPVWHSRESGVTSESVAQCEWNLAYWTSTSLYKGYWSVGIQGYAMHYCYRPTPNYHEVLGRINWHFYPLGGKKLEDHGYTVSEVQAMFHDDYMVALNDMRAFMGMLSEDESIAKQQVKACPYASSTDWYYDTLNPRITSYFKYEGDIVDESDLFDPYYDEIPLGKLHPRPAGLESHLCGKALSSTSFNTNSIANGLELFDLALKLKHLDIKGAFKRVTSVTETLSDMWLKYRYAYCTTKSDIEELGRFLATNSDGGPTVARAGDSLDTGTMHVKILMRPKSNSLGETVNRLTEYGAAPSLYNLWDLVPFSFIVDWFADIGDVLEDVTQYGRCAAFDIQSLTTSWKWYDYVKKAHTRARLDYFQRWVSPTVPTYIPYVEQGSASGETIVKRFADSVALIGS